VYLPHARASAAVANERVNGAVHAMHAEGMSVRAIAAATTRSKSAVARSCPGACLRARGRAGAGRCCGVSRRAQCGMGALPTSVER